LLLVRLFRQQHQGLWGLVLGAGSCSRAGGVLAPGCPGWPGGGVAGGVAVSWGARGAARARPTRAAAAGLAGAHAGVTPAEANLR
jgi:hypothetical protein